LQWQEVVCCCGSDDVEGVVWEWQLRNRGLPYFDAAGLHPACICSLAENDAFFGIVDAVYFTFRCDCGQLLNGSPATTTHIKDRVVVRHRDVLQGPVCQFRTARIHSPQSESTQPPRRLAALIYHGLSWRSRWLSCHSNAKASGHLCIHMYA